MIPARFAPGTKSKSTPSDYTDKQYAALEGLKCKDPELRFGAARQEFVNHVLLADGTISDDLKAVGAACVAAQTAYKAALQEFIQKHQEDILQDTLTDEGKMVHARLKSAARHALLDEFEAAVQQNRFLFIVDIDLVPRIYFQCFTGVDDKGKSLNPDVEIAVTPAATPKESA